MNVASAVSFVWDTKPDLPTSSSKPTLEGFARGSLMSFKLHVPNFPPLGLIGLAHEPRLERFLTFITSICWSLNNLVSAPLPLEV